MIEQRTLLIKDKEGIKLTPREAALFEFLLEHKNDIVKREAVLQKILSKTDYFAGRSMDVYINRLRNHLKQDASITIHSIRSLGYQLEG
ncbi:MAG: winged helix-turn-helix domain-containing protein [Bacteroidota bacterium]|nr:winged helix-turn-helix domain-containing protein [Bacteroidota bacterium]